MSLKSRSDILRKPQNFEMVTRFSLTLLNSKKSGSFDLSIASTKTKYIKLNTKTQNIFCGLNENLTTFSYTLTGGTRKQKGKKVSSLKVLTKVEFYFSKIGFSYLVLCIWFQ